MLGTDGGHTRVQSSELDPEKTLALIEALMMSSRAYSGDHTEADEQAYDDAQALLERYGR